MGVMVALRDPTGLKVLLSMVKIELAAQLDFWKVDLRCRLKLDRMRTMESLRYLQAYLRLHGE